MAIMKNAYGCLLQCFQNSLISAAELFAAESKF